MICAMYLRKSRADMDAELRGEGETLARHRDTLCRVAAQQNLTISDVYSEVVSGDTIAERPEMQRMLRAIERGEYDAILCMDIDRLGRGDGSDQSIILKALKYTGTLIITPYKTYDIAREMDEEFFEYAQFMARGEYKRIKRRMWAGRVAAAKEGKWQSPKAPFGYRRIRIENGKGWTLTPDPAESDAVRSIFAWYASGAVGKNIIANRVNDMGFRTQSGALFEASAIASILRNPTYIGKIRWCWRRKRVDMVEGKEVITRPLSSECMINDGLHPAIIDINMWNAVQARLASNPDPRALAIKNPLSGLLFCSACGRAMIRSPEYDRSGVESTVRCRTRNCPTTGIDVQCVYDALLHALRQWSNFADSLPDESSADPAQEDSPALAAAIAQLAQLKNQMSRLQDLLETGVYSAETYVDRSRLLNARMSTCEQEITRLQAARHVDDRAAIARLKPDIDHVLDVWDSSTPEQRNILLRKILRKVVYKKTKRCFRNDNPADYLTLDLFPVLK